MTTTIFFLVVYIACIFIITLIIGFMTNAYADTDSVLDYADDTAIFNNPPWKVFAITVETNKGQVQLSSTVNTPADIEPVLELARKVRHIKGVRSVSTMLRINEAQKDSAPH